MLLASRILYTCLLLQYTHTKSVSASQCQSSKHVTCTQFMWLVASLGGDPTTFISESRSARLLHLSTEECYVLVNSPKTYKEASNICSKAGGHLAWIESPGVVNDLHTNAMITEPSGFKDGIWIGITINSKSGSPVLDCPTSSPPKSQSKQAYCSPNEPVEPGSATICKDGQKSPCLCWRKDTQARLPFYCQINSICDVKTAANCDTFKNKVQQVVPKETVIMLPGAERAGLSTSSCYVLVNHSIKWENASAVCEAAGGRLAWIPESSPGKYNEGVETLLNFTIKHNALDSDGLSAWVGLKRWGFKIGSSNPKPLWVFQWVCPASRGQGIKYVDSNPYFEMMNQTAPLWVLPGADPGRAFYAHLEKYYEPSLNDFSIDNYVNKLLPYFCEAQIGSSQFHVKTTGDPSTPVMPTDGSKRNNRTCEECNNKLVVILLSVGIILLLIVLGVLAFVCIGVQENKGNRHFEPESLSGPRSTSAMGDSSSKSSSVTAQNESESGIAASESSGPIEESSFSPQSNANSGSTKSTE